ncbi:flagellar basal-body rod protein FlgF [Rhizobiales bacterium]|uniref:flagellar basal-body rod protein FlgF n=1 Tax=Hongsoonwoonella zoysiae TaxID=2821844 RepID=UPI00155FC4A2|nr:flagellar basal-body rod protein FlgF [Hongsoonwoonella zoysiae]NRG18018.1 flagellar basal-body rod protein FlgF [Hongsoonwoonella zoysiae]
MENALLIGLSRQTTLRNQLDVVANNIANINTTGYKSQSILFEEYLMPVAEASDFQGQDKTLSYVVDYKSIYDQSQGAFTQTGNPLDIAISGEGFFVVETEDGEAYTRNGAFHLDNTGQLVTADGKPVLGDGGPLQFAPEDGTISIAEDGTVSTDLGEKGKLRLVRFEDPEDLDRIGENLFEGEDAEPVLNPRLTQGTIERSNVQGVVEITRMIEITRSYQAVSKMISDGNDLSRKAIEELGTIRA